MKYSRFEEFGVEGCDRAGRSDLSLDQSPSLQDPLQLTRISLNAPLFVSNNIAEGFERGTTQELLTILYIARGSGGEVRSMLCLLEGLPGFDHLKLRSEGVSRQLRAWADSLAEFRYPGTKI